MSNVAIFYSSTLVQSIVSMNIAYLKYNISGNTVTIKDVAGQNEGTMTTTIDEFTTGTQHEICVCCPTQATYSATGKLTYDQVAYLDQKLVTANKGTSVRANTCQANSTVTEIVLDAGASATNDTYNGKFIKTAGVTAVYRYISDYVGSTKACTVATTTTPVTTTSTFIVYTNDHIYLLGDASSSENACRVAWRTIFSTANIPYLVKLMGGSGTGFKNCPLTVLTATSVAAGSLTNTSAFTLNAYTGGNFYCAILSASGGNYMAGQSRKITSNTASVLTLESNWDVTPTGTVTYAIYSGESILYDKYLDLAIPTYLWNDTAANANIFKAMLDRYGDIVSQDNVAALTFQDLATIDDYAKKGKAIYDAKCAGVVS